MLVDNERFSLMVVHSIIYNIISFSYVFQSLLLIIAWQRQGMLSKSFQPQS